MKNIIIIFVLLLLVPELIAQFHVKVKRINSDTAKLEKWVVIFTCNDWKTRDTLKESSAFVDNKGNILPIRNRVFFKKEHALRVAYDLNCEDAYLYIRFYYQDVKEIKTKLREEKDGSIYVR